MKMNYNNETFISIVVVMILVIQSPSTNVSHIMVVIAKTIVPSHNFHTFLENVDILFQKWDLFQDMECIFAVMVDRRISLMLAEI